MTASIWIDADSCPAQVRKYAANYAFNHAMKCVFVANRNIMLEGARAELVVCAKEKDAADEYIIQHVLQNDIVITQDILLASKLVTQGISVINDRGTAFTKDNIQNRLSDRAFDLQLAQIGLGGSRRSRYTAKYFNAFIQCLEKEAVRALQK